MAWSSGWGLLTMLGLARPVTRWRRAILTTTVVAGRWGGLRGVLAWSWGTGMARGLGVARWRRFASTGVAWGVLVAT